MVTEGWLGLAYVATYVVLAGSVGFMFYVSGKTVGGGTKVQQALHWTLGGLLFYLGIELVALLTGYQNSPLWRLSLHAVYALASLMAAARFHSVTAEVTSCTSEFIENMRKAAAEAEAATSRRKQKSSAQYDRQRALIVEAGRLSRQRLQAIAITDITE